MCEQTPKAALAARPSRIALYGAALTLTALAPHQAVSAHAEPGDQPIAVHAGPKVAHDAAPHGAIAHLAAPGGDDAGPSTLAAVLAPKPAPAALLTRARFSTDAAPGPGRALAPQTADGVAPPSGAVGQPPPPPPPETPALPEGINILTPPGRVIVDSALSYTQSSNDRLVFRGVEIVPGVQVGLIDANNTDRTQFAVVETLRTGITRRFEVEAVVPFVYGEEKITEVVQRETEAIESTRTEGSGLGDVELVGRYQLTAGRPGDPLLIANLRVKTPTGEGSFDVDFDEFGVLEELPTGSGFWGVEPSVTALMRSDPAVLFASFGYLVNIERDIDKTIGDVEVGQVNPGDAVNLSVGFSLALNQAFSTTLGFRGSHFFETTQELNGIEEEGDSLQAAALLLGMSYQFSRNVRVVQNFEFGVTPDAPNLVWTTRIPFTL